LASLTPAAVSGGDPGRASSYFSEAGKKPEKDFTSISGRARANLLKKLYDQSSGLFHNFRMNDDFSAEQRNVFGPPFEFFYNGYSKVSCFNAFVGSGLLKSYSAGGGAQLLPFCEKLADSIEREFKDTTGGGYFILNTGGKYKAAINDAIILTFYTELFEITRAGRHRERAIEASKSIIKTYIGDGTAPACCMTGGKKTEKMYSRDALVVMSLAYAGRVFGKDDLKTAARALMDYFLKVHFVNDHFIDWENLGTDSEMGMGLLAVFKQTGARSYLDAAMKVATYWSAPIKLENQSIVDMLEFYIFLTSLAGISGSSGYSSTAAGVIDSVVKCFSEQKGLFPTACNSNLYYSVINGIALIALE
jgi:hypothetical protein